MKLRKYNEALFSQRELWGWDDDEEPKKPKKDYDMLYLKNKLVARALHCEINAIKKQL